MNHAKALAAIGGARSVIGTVAPLDQEGLQMEVDCDLMHHTGPSLGPAAVSSALAQLLFGWFLLIHLQTNWCNFCQDFAEIVYVCTNYPLISLTTIPLISQTSVSHP